MPLIQPVSDLRNYNEVLQNVTDSKPVFLTKNGRGCSAILSMHDYEKLNATSTLFSELQKGEFSATNNGWIDSSQIKRKYKINE